MNVIIKIRSLPLLMTLISFYASGQLMIQGPTTVSVHQIVNYSTNYHHSAISMISWNGSQGTSDGTVTLQWTQPGIYHLECDLYTHDNQHHYADIYVTVVETGPPAPNATNATNITSSSFTATWSGSSDALSYRLDVSPYGTFQEMVPGYDNLLVNTTSQNVTSLASGATYYYRVRAVNNSGMSVNSNVIAVITSGTPAVPLASSSHIRTNSFTAKWNGVPGATSYQLDVATNSTFTNKLASYNNISVNEPAKTVNDLTPNTQYYFRVRSVNAAGLSAYSNTVSVTTAQVPAAPILTAVTGVTSTAFTANWNSVANAIGYRIDVSTSNSFSSFLPPYENRSVTGTNFTVSGLIGGLTYYYRVRVLTDVGVSPYSSVGSVTIILAAPAAPEALTATNPVETSFTANWNPIANAASYRLDVSTNKNFTSFVSGYNNLTVNATSRSVTGLTAKTTYYYRVRAVNAAGTSLNSNIIMGINSDQNYIVSNDIQVAAITTPAQVEQATINQKMTQINYFDGLGRPIQSVTKQGSPQQKDMVQPVAYDQFGRETVQYLPYVSTENDGWYKSNFVNKDHASYTTSPQYQFYQSTSSVAHDPKPYSETKFEPSPLNRVLKQGAPGEAWQPNDNPTLDHSIKKAYGANVANEVLWFTYDAATSKVNVKQQNGALRYYAPNELSTNKTIDEHNNEVIEYTDKEGRTLLKKVQYDVQGTTKLYASTYYIYDIYGNLVFVLPPEGVKSLMNVEN